jgi:hypothetical protein
MWLIMKKIKKFQEFLNEEVFGLSKKEKDEKEEEYRKRREKHNEEIQDIENQENQELVNLFSKKDDKKE